MKTLENNYTKEWHITGDEISSILDCATHAITDSEMFGDDVAERLGIDDSEMKSIRNKLHDDPAKMHVIKCVNSYPELKQSNQEMREALEFLFTQFPKYNIRPKTPLYEAALKVLLSTDKICY